jgi:hypothetical protein
MEFNTPSKFSFTPAYTTAECFVHRRNDICYMITNERLLIPIPWDTLKLLTHQATKILFQQINFIWKSLIWFHVKS